jgi:predicted nuclease with TOPRIM domain
VKKDETLAASAVSKYELDEQKLSARESTIDRRLEELEAHEQELRLKEAQLEAEFEVREQRLEAREKEGAELAEQLRSREGALSVYVAQLQEEFDRRETDWWSKQLGREPKAPAA